MTIKTEVKSISPADAANFLIGNNHNRPLSGKNVSFLANAMKNGEWRLNGEPIIISKSGRLIDGQHRLQAVIDTGTTQDFLVVYGVDDDAFCTVDVGKKRTVADALVAFDAEKYRPCSAAIASAISLLSDIDTKGEYCISKRRITHESAIDFVNKNKGLLRSYDVVSSMSGAKKLAPISCLCAMYFVLSKIDIDKAEMFFFKLNTGEKMSSGDPILALRQKLIDEKSTQRTVAARDVIRYFIKAWNSIYEGKELKRFRVDESAPIKILGLE